LKDGAHDGARAFVHQSSFVDEPVRIGAGTRIWHFCHIMANASIGEGCTIGQNVVVMSGVKIGNNVKIQNNVSIYGGVELEDDVFCGPSMVFTNVRTPRSGTPRNRPEDYVRTLVKRGASIGANATILCGTTIGEFGFVGAGAVVTRDVPPYARAFGNPARVRGYSCECGQNLKFSQGAARCPECGRRYVLAGDLVTPAAVPS
jgi:UDP-2-acetamido-3-amino-2,3-dideoxy-glucuronate N-acetyltransferase